MSMTKELILHTLMEIVEKVGLDLDGDLVTFIPVENGVPVTYSLNVKMFINDCAPMHNGKLHKDNHINTWEEAEKLVTDIYNGKYRAIMSANLNHIEPMKYPRARDVDFDVRGCDISAITGRF